METYRNPLDNIYSNSNEHLNSLGPSDVGIWWQKSEAIGDISKGPQNKTSGLFGSGNGSDLPPPPPGWGGGGGL